MLRAMTAGAQLKQKTLENFQGFMRPQETWREAGSHYWRPCPCGRSPSCGAPFGIMLI